MATLRTRFLFHWLILSTAISAVGSTGAGCDSGNSGKRVDLFIFGDSYFDAGNNNYINTSTLDQANFLPYGETYFKFPTGRFSNGRLITDFIAEYAKLPLIPPFLKPGKGDYTDGVNFASGGAGVLSETFKGQVIDLRTQLSYFMKVRNALRSRLGNADTSQKLSNAVYMFSIGTNDYISPFLTNSTNLKSHSQYVNMVIGNFTAVIKAIYDMGGRKFSFLNLGDLGCLPGLRILEPKGKGACFKEASNLAKLHNHALHKLLSKMHRRLEGFQYSLYDFNRDLKRRMNHPSLYGLEEGKSACCGTGRFRGVYSCGGKRLTEDYEVCVSPNKYVFWDSYHLSETMYQQMATQMWKGSTTRPYALNTFFRCQ